jgi:hypothetical protein
VNLRSSYDDGSVRTIAATFDGVQGNRGWQFGVTGKKSRYKPETLVLLLSGDGTPESEPTEPIFSGVSIEPGKPYFVAVSVKLGDTSESGVTFYVKDMTNDDQPIIVAGVSHRTHANLRTTAPLSIGGRSGAPKHLWDGVIDDVRLSIVALEKDQLLFTKEGLTQHTCGYWRFEPEPGVFKDSTPAARDIQARTVAAPKVDAKQSALVDFCHVLLNSNEFLYVD